MSESLKESLYHVLEILPIAYQQSALQVQLTSSLLTLEKLTAKFNALEVCSFERKSELEVLSQVAVDFLLTLPDLSYLYNLEKE